MTSVVKNLIEKQIIKPEKFIEDNTHYEVIMGSVAYGISDDTSDLDIYGFCIPPKFYIFSHLAGEIQGFGKQHKRFDQYQKHGISYPDGKAGKGQIIDLNIYNIVKYFDLCLSCNPNMIDSLFVPQRCVLHCSRIGNMVRENRRSFLNKSAFHRYKSYAYSELNRIKNSKPKEGSKREKLIDTFGYDTKNACNVVRLADQAQQILTEGDLDLERNREQLKSIRRGEWKFEQIQDYFTSREEELNTLYNESKVIPNRPDEEKIKQLLLNCLEEHYGKLDDSHVAVNDKYFKAFREIQEIVDKNR
ncbi:MAG: nucleotidyltransferase domain-containing protein [Nanoarchaeota archaeon]